MKQITKTAFKQAVETAGGIRAVGYYRRDPATSQWRAVGQNRLAGWRDYSKSRSDAIVFAGNNILDLDKSATVESDGKTYVVTWTSKSGNFDSRAAYVLDKTETLNALTVCNACDAEQMHDGCAAGYCAECCTGH